jgi:enamine deaminase RidA (YjgF/YER057c/UK114 family)
VISRFNPPSMHEPPGYHHVTVAQPGVLVLLAGQCPLDGAGVLVGPGDVRSQAAQVAGNIATALTAAGARPSDVVRTVIYVASSDRDDLVTVWEVLTRSDVAEAFTSASTLLGVSQLGFPSQLVEVDVTAVLPAG